MATRFSNTLRCDSAVAANIQAWAQFIEDTLVTTGGWVVTSDTGQTLPASLPACTGVSQKKGYRIYRMNDSLQSVSPVFMRLDFGSGSYAGAGQNPGIWPTIGTGSDGTGNITGKLWDGGSITNPPVCSTISASQAAIATNSYGSAGTNRFSIGLFIQTTNTLPMVFTMERTKDASGVDTSDGLLLVYTDPSLSGGGGTTNALSFSRYIQYPVGPQPAAEWGLSYALTTQNPTQTFGGTIGAGIIIHFKGIAQQPGTNVVIVNAADMSAEGSMSLIIYGATRTYQHMNVVIPMKALISNITVPPDPNARVCIRYD